MTILQKKIQRLISQLAMRVPARTAQRILKKAGLKTGRSIEDTIIYVEDLTENKLTPAYRKLKNCIENLHLFGAKALRILEIKESDRNKVKDFFESLEPEYNFPSVRCFPRPLSEKALIKEDMSTPRFIKSYPSATGMLYIFSCKHQVSFREIYEDDLESSFGEIASKYDKIIAISEKNIQFYNSIFVSTNFDYMELRIDLADLLGTTVLREVMDKFESQLDFKFFQKHKMPLPTGRVNFFPMIQKIYDQKDDGYIFDLAFQCPTGANRRENLSNFGKELDVKDLRQEDYHVAGTNKIGNIFIPYKIGISWDADVSGENLSGTPELILSGTIIMAKENANILDYAIVRNTIDETDFNYVISAIHDYV